MAKNKKLREEKRREIFNTKTAFIKYAKRYGVILLCSFPIIMIITYILGINFSWYTTTVAFFASFAMLLLALLIGIIVYSKIDDKRAEEQEQNPEKRRDPFAD